MIEELAERLAEYFVRSGQIAEEDTPLYALGFEVVLSTLLTAAAICLAGFFLHNVAGAVVFLLCFSHIRNDSGGFHASTRWRCFFTSVFCYLATYGAVFCMGRLPGVLRIAAVLAVSLSSAAAFYIWAPVENKNKRLPPDWKKRNRGRTFVSVGIWLFVAAVCLVIWPKLAWQIFATVWVVAVLLLFAEEKRTYK